MRILHLEDNDFDAEMILKTLQDEWSDCVVSHAKSELEFRQLLRSRQHDIILSDYTLVDFTGMEALRMASEVTPFTPFVFFSGTIPEDLAIAAMREGASDYVLKDRPTRLVSAIRRALEKSSEDESRRAAELALMHSEARFRQLFDQAADPTVVYDSAGNFRDVNRAACAALGLSRTELLARKVWEVDPGFHSEGQVAAHSRAMRGSAVTCLGIRCRGESTIFPVEIRLSRFDSGDTRQFLSSFRDISERRKAEQRIRELTDLLDQSGEAIIVTGLSGQVVSWNRGAERLLGWKFSEVEGLRLDELPGLNTLSSPKRGEEVREWRSAPRVSSKIGKVLTLETHHTIVRDESNVPRGVVCIASDATEKAVLIERVIRAQRLESLGMLAAGIAHDLNNLMAPARMIPTVIRERIPDPATGELLDILESCAQRSSDMVKQIMTYATGSLAEITEFDLTMLLSSLIQFVGQTFPKSIQVELSCATDLWPLTASMAQINQVILNLCINARDAMPSGGILRVTAENRTVALGTEIAGKTKPGEWLKIQIQDQGIGIPDYLLQKIWEPFFTTKEPEQGTGLGLSTVRGIIENHRGFITVDSAPGVGSIFSVFLPAQRAAV